MVQFADIGLVTSLKVVADLVTGIDVGSGTDYRAIANDGEFKDEALNDAAFRDYWNDPAFKDMAEG